MYLDRREKNIETFKDTQKLINESEYLKSAINNSIEKEILYLEEDEINLCDISNLEKTCDTVISTKRSFEAAESYAKEGKKVCVLNFASATNPGGGVINGSSAQEEALCRCSTLYNCLNTSKMWNRFYVPHREKDNPIYNDDCIYSPDIIVFKKDITFPERMDSKDWYKVDVLSCAAPNLRHLEIEDDDISKLYVKYVKRIERIFRVAVSNDVEVLILGAFGCGAFRNPPCEIAKAFKEAHEKYEQYFKVIEYAIFCTAKEQQNYNAFCEVFGKYRGALRRS